LQPSTSLILISGYPFAEESELRERVQKLSAHFLAKPFEISELTALVEQIMATHIGEAQHF